MKIAVISYGRADIMTALNHLPGAVVVVPKSQEGEYRKRWGRAVFPIPDEADGSYTKKFNSVLSIIGDDVMVCDDDFDGLLDLQTGSVVSPVDTVDLIRKGWVMAKDVGAGMWGFNHVGDPGKYRSFHPFSFTKPSYWLVGCMKDRIIHDPAFEPPQFAGDVDFWLQKINRYRKTFRFNRYFPIVKVGSLEGGIGLAKKTRRYDYICRKWGSRIVALKEDGTIEVHSPIQGV